MAAHGKSMKEQGSTAAARAASRAASKVDHTLLRANQTGIIFFLVLAWLFNSIWLVAFVAAVMVIGSIAPRYSLFKWVAQRWLEPNLLKPDIKADSPQPHLFAQTLGGVMLVLATLALLFGWTSFGWVLTAIVVILAGINLFAGFCAGCFLYYQLGRYGIRPALPSWG